MADVKLKEAMAEIIAVLKKHDIASQITLVSQTHSEFRFYLEPSWSCAKEEYHPEGIALRFKATKKEIPDKDIRHKIVEETMHAILQIRDLNAQNFVAFDRMVEQLGQHMEIDHKPFSGYEPHNEQ